ncbi:anthranilate phosphoribosyltransferase [Shewanella surugensis]|uniref:Anthranilate phosphoribosyltransferase n=1 Tax=Shewanella surugensis TaxID=212020 RepID=A0ABT0LHH8_9GAMM|nr:anthranilate phosphoribosyltransferase [Shewanella surugensis]MCL1127154.1 anthranilate phosphoribosyltransferase [Shewanella surugensis]
MNKGDAQQALLERLYQGHSLSRDETRLLFTDIMQGQMSETAMAAMLIAIKIHGETIDQITGAADALRAVAKTFPVPNEHIRAKGILDIVGTGGDGHDTINISTMSAFVAAAAGANVAKHGNRSATSQTGSSDLLSQFGINLTMSPETACHCLNTLRLCFLFAPHYHGGFKHAMPVRKALKTRTLFNVLGPLINPAAPDFMLLGVYSPALVAPIAQVLNALGIKRAMVVHGSGLDEVAIHGETLVNELVDGHIREYHLTPTDVGLPLANLSDIKGGCPSENAVYTQNILQGQGKTAHTHAVAINAGCALYVAGLAESPKAGTKLALDTIKSGRPFALLTKLATASQQEA